MNFFLSCCILIDFSFLYLLCGCLLIFIFLFLVMKVLLGNNGIWVLILFLIILFWLFGCVIYDFIGCLVICLIVMKGLSVFFFKWGFLLFDRLFVFLEIFLVRGFLLVLLIEVVICVKGYMLFFKYFFFFGKNL